MQFAVAGLIFLTLVAYHNSFSGPFVFDDLPSIVENTTIRKLSAVGDVLFPPGNSTVNGRPVVNASLAVSYALSGNATWGYHAINLLIHLLAGLTLFGLVRRTLQQPSLAARFSPDALPLATIVAALWLLHPLQTESVTYIIQRAESLMGLFYLLTFYFFLRGTTSTSPGRWYALATASCAAGMGSKEVMVSAPLMVLLYDRAFVAGTWRDALRQRTGLYVALASTWLLLGGLVLSAGGNRGGSIGFGIGVSWWAHALTQFQAVVHYLWLSLWPHPLVFDYEPEWVHGLGDVLPYALLVAALLAATVTGLRRASPVGFLGVWFFAILAPTSFMPAPRQLIVEHRMYLPLAAVIAFVVPGVYRWAGRRGLMVFLAPIAVFGVLTALRNADYRSELALWSDTVAKQPGNAIAHGNLGNALSRAGRMEDALAHYTEAVRLQPALALQRYNLARALATVNRLPEAVLEYAEALRLEPNYAEAHNNFGVALARLGRNDEARVHFEKALNLRPTDAETHYNLGLLLAQTGRFSEAIDHYARTLQLKPDHAAACIHWGTALVQLDRLPEALARYEEALRIDPRNVTAHNKVGLIFLVLGRVAEAIPHFEAALRLKPDDAEARANLAMARARQVNASGASLELRSFSLGKPRGPSPATRFSAAGAEGFFSRRPSSG